MLISDELFADFLACETKAHLVLMDGDREPSEYVTSDLDDLQTYQQFCAHRLRERLPEDVCLTGCSTVADLERTDIHFFLHCPVEVDGLRSLIPAVERSTSLRPSDQPVFVPIRFVSNNKITKRDRLLLAYSAYVLSKLMGRPCPLGKIIYGDKHMTLRVELTGDMPTVEDVIQKIENLHSAKEPPPLLLNRHCPECQFQRHCRQTAIDRDELTLLSGMTGAERQKLHSKGIFTITQLSYTFRPRRRSKCQASSPEKYHHSLRALAIRQGKVHVVGSPQLSITGTPIYFDVEGVPDRGFYYLIGARIKLGDSYVQHSFWANNTDGESDIWTSFLEQVAEVENPQLIHYGSYETTFLKTMQDRYARDTAQSALAQHLIAGSVNVLSAIYSQIYFPTYSNGLKDVAAFLGFQWSEAEASGLSAILWRRRWEATGDARWKDKLVTYNAEDCQALEKVASIILHLTTEQPGSHVVPGDAWVHTASLERETPYSFGRVEFATPELQYINECAYWSYQHDRVHLRDKASRRKRSGEKSSESTQPMPINKVVEYPAQHSCPVCQGKDLKTIKRRTKTIYDLNFSRSGVKKWVVKYVSARYACHRCKSRFNSPGPAWTASRYGHNLMAYMVYLLIDGRLSFKSVSRNIRDLFAYDFRYTVISDQKSRASLFYQETYERILSRIISGHVVHADETRIRLRDREGYVWVLASLHEVTYFYTDTREGSTIQRLLQDFKGTLVSDFYPVYDSISCVQQKCLIHLIRDLNEDILSEPFNEEYKKLVQDFTSVLKPAIDTIDQYGLKARYLRKHKAMVARFYQQLTLADFKTELAVKWRQRFEKNKEKLFTFLDRDGVPWNNNFAEHAIKRFAALREGIDGSTSEKGLQEYLILLSISESCRYREMSFLDFLLSGELDVVRDIGNCR
jgi:predicted RecB family nuclease